MFTGLVTHVGEIVRVAQTATGRELTVAVPWADIAVGESIALNGVCLTVTNVGGGQFTVSAVTTTLDCTTTGAWRAGSRVNLERALRVSDRLGGHLVQGHVDGVGDVLRVRVDVDALLIEFSLWEGAETLCIPRGSIAIDGVSLTIHSMPSPNTIEVAVVEHTRKNTTLADLRAGARVNVELDMIGKYVRQVAAPWSAIADPVR